MSEDIQFVKLCIVAPFPVVDFYRKMADPEVVLEVGPQERLVVSYCDLTGGTRRGGAEMVRRRGGVEVWTPKVITWSGRVSKPVKRLQVRVIVLD